MWRTKFSRSSTPSAKRRASAIATLGASLGAYHAANTLLKHPDHVKRCYALSGIYDMRDSMDGMYDDNFYFNNPVDYMADQNDPWYLHQYASCDIRLVTGCGPWENSGPTYRMSEILRNRGIAHHLDDWGPRGRARMALLASPDVGIRRRALLRIVRFASGWPDQREFARANLAHFKAPHNVDLRHRATENCDRQNSEIHFASATVCDRSAVSHFDIGWTLGVRRFPDLVRPRSTSCANLRGRSVQVVLNSW